jgi:hypothetical protein
MLTTHPRQERLGRTAPHDCIEACYECADVWLSETYLQELVRCTVSTWIVPMSV